MIKEQQELIDEAYADYLAVNPRYRRGEYGEENVNWYTYLTKEEYIKKIIGDCEFSKRRKLEIEERELSLGERFRIAYKDLELRKKLEAESMLLHYPDGHNKVMCDSNIPNKLIRVTYKDKTKISYE